MTTKYKKHQGGVGKGANPAAIFSGGFGRFREFRGCHARAVSGASGVNGLKMLPIKYEKNAKKIRNKT